MPPNKFFLGNADGFIRVAQGVADGLRLAAMFLQYRNRVIDRGRIGNGFSGSSPA
jgi:hypothetical protein